MYTFMHAADLHLDSPLRGLSQYDGAPADEIRHATRRALTHLVDLAITEQVAFVVIAGDLYDGDWRDYNTGLFFVAEMARLREAQIPVYLVSGNHDAASRITKTLRLPENVYLFSDRKPETKKLDQFGVALHGQSFATRDIYDNLAATYPPREDGYLNIGLLHTSATGGFGHDPYATCSLETLLAAGYDYWALGHIHARLVLHEDPWIVFAGNTQGRHIRETGAKGCTLVTVDDGQVSTVEHRELDVLRWHLLEVRVDAHADAHAVLEHLHQHLSALVGTIDCLHAVRVRLTGAGPAHAQLHADPTHWTNEIRAIATDVGNGLLWVEDLRLATAPPHTLPAATHDAVGTLVQMITDWSADDERIAGLADELQDLAVKLPHEFRTDVDGLDPTDPAVIKAALAKIGTLLQSEWQTPGGVA